ncbi:hypothetical protein F511_15952 [Dorcoceras hygrometricum]|uniref:Uncharacterized protein n=1 Tax=Dorcoceras hygrometricum TaxID=472368 RepID=A0A2Z7BW22_9LAMI|nr:hypothetical protein F511_15952 [Dorcoceras hygrometricum]
MESEDLVNDEVRVKWDCGECRRCLEKENEITRKYLLLELEIEEKKNVIVRLVGKLENEVNVLRQKNKELQRVTGKENGVVDLTMDDGEDKITKLVIENSVLECEKKKAECEIAGWKVKCKELEIQVMELRKLLQAEMSRKGLDFTDMDLAHLNGKSGPNPVPVAASPVENYDENESNEDNDVTAVTPPGDTSSKTHSSADEMKGSCQSEFNVKCGRRVIKCLSFTEDKSPLNSFSPSTPGGRPPVDVIYIDDSDGNLDAPNIDLQDLELTGRKVSFNSTHDGLGNAMYEKKLISKVRRSSVLEHQGEEEEDFACYNGSKPYLLTPKRRRVSKIVTSDSESDDNIPIGKLMCKNQLSHGLNSNMNSNSAYDTESQDSIDEPKPRRRLMKQQNFAEMGKERQKNVGTPKQESDEEENQLDDSVSEGENLGGFIVNSSDDCSDVSAKDTFTESEDSDSGMDYKEIMSGLRRDGKHKMMWDFEAEMLADFGKSPEICMKAVCALYRQQTSEEKSCKATINLNGRGFSQCDAYRGSALAEFLTNGEPQSDMEKSVEELLVFNPNGDELCRELAERYSKQLFAIYQSGEDPFFKPPEPVRRC